MSRLQIVYRGRFTVACSNGHVKSLKNVVDSRIVDLKQGDEPLGMRGLILAIKAGHLDIVKYLTEGCHVDIHDNKEMALLYAARKENLYIVKYLIEKGADYQIFKNDLYRKEEYNFCIVVAQAVEAEKRKPLPVRPEKIKKAEQRFKDNLALLKQEGITKKPVRRRPVFKK